MDSVALTTFSMTARSAEATRIGQAIEERVIGRDMQTDGPVLGEAILSRVEEVTALQMIDELGKLGADWDGYGGLPIDKLTIANSSEALVRLMRSGARGPDIAPNPNGTISFEWMTVHGSAHLEVGMTRYSFFLQAASARPFVTDGPAGHVPTELGTAIAAIVFPPVRSVAAIHRLIYTAGHDRTYR